MKIQYKKIKFREQSLQIIEHAEEILDRMENELDLDLTVRQLYYQFIAHDLFPESWRDDEGTKNNQRSYKKLVSLLGDARLSGMLSWHQIEDKTRSPRLRYSQTDMTWILESIHYDYVTNKWEGQENHVEVWVEKEAQENIVQKAADPLSTPYFACRGYTSQTAMHDAAERLIKRANEGKKIILLHLGDFDPSGIDMTRDIKDRLTLFGVPKIKVKRIALNMDQIRRFNPPPSPAKLKDSRAKAYIKEYGRDCWELDALDPHYTIDLVTKEIKKYLDVSLFNSMVEKQEEKREVIKDLTEDLVERFNDLSE